MGDLFDFFNFDRPSYIFNRVTKDMTPTYMIEKDGKVFVLLNALGISKEDIQVEVKSTDNQNVQHLVVTGKTHNDVFNKDYTINMTFVSWKPMRTVEWDAKDGLVTIVVEYDEPAKPSVKITRR
jgi:HSP20 family molecular chaperone IbpA